MHCPLCQSENDQKELFKTLSAFTSTVKFDTKQLVNNPDDSDSGGGIVKVIILSL
ncbi:sugar transferase [Campylobacter jejuni]|nr:sugar transferase [Campylobacter jejuni]ECL7250844.1 sugar transferase [Campylobacter jejuni]EEO6953155.1 sugar transferase [Campylobacter jejuni]EFS0701347.1 sugar transferase [Campylobacter jejuni]HED5367188.1 sugar transferase [Campylobacter jejuni]